jgi:23S rRNA methyltransferase
MIESFQNPKIKNLIRLTTDNRFRKKQKAFIVEGQQENERALKFNFKAIEFFICEEIFNSYLPNEKINLVSKEIYEKIAYRGTSEGIIGIYEEKENSLQDYQPSENASIIILEGIEKPGNLGAILRSCEAFGIEALIITDPKVDFYNPNVIRSSVGCIFGMNIFSSQNEELLSFLKENQFQIFTTLMSQDAQSIHEKDYTKKSAILFGTEHSGLSNFWKDKGDNILVPMVGTIDSLNLSNAVAITCYEILRQKISH